MPSTFCCSDAAPLALSSKGAFAKVQAQTRAQASLKQAQAFVRSPSVHARARYSQRATRLAPARVQRPPTWCGNCSRGPRAMSERAMRYDVRYASLVRSSNIITEHLTDNTCPPLPIKDPCRGCPALCVLHLACCQDMAPAVSTTSDFRVGDGWAVQPSYSTNTKNPLVLRDRNSSAPLFFFLVFP